MTVPSEVNRSGPYNGNGSATMFNYGFRIVDENDLSVIKTVAGVETVLVIDTDYIVSDVGDAAGGQIAISPAPPTGSTITILRNVPFTQETDLQNQGAYYAETIEKALDKSVMRDQQLSERLDRAVLIPASADASDLDALVEDILRLGDSADNIDTVAGISADVTTVAANDEDISTAADNIAAIIAAPSKAAEAEASSVSAAAFAAGVDLPAVTANTMLVDNAAGDAREAKTFSEVVALLGVGRGSEKVIQPFVFDMHFGVLRGFGFNSTAPEPGGRVTYTLASAASIGDTTLTLTGGSNAPKDAMLIVYLSTDGTYYTAVCLNVSGTTVTISRPLEAPVAAGGNVFNFYINESHPNTEGYYAITDALIRENLRTWRQIYKAAPVAYGTSSLSTLATNNPFNPGSADVPAWVVTPTASSSGCQWPNFYPRKTGLHRAVVKFNKSTATGTVVLRINGLYQEVITSKDAGVHYLDFYAPNLDPIYILGLADGGSFFISELEILEYQGDVLGGWDSGRHFIFGDSWAGINSDIGEGPGILDRFRARFPNATFVNKGVGGNHATHLVARYDDDILADIQTNGPVKNITVITGTNDFYGNETPETVRNNLGIVVARSVRDGMNPIVFTPSNASYDSSVTSGPGDGAARFNLARRYTNEIAYFPQELENGAGLFTPAPVGTTTAGATSGGALTGSYSVINGRCFFDLNMSWSSHTGTGNLEILGLPRSSTAHSMVSLLVSGVVFSNRLQGYVKNGTDKIILGTSASDGAFTALPIDGTNVYDFKISGNYPVA